MRLRAPLAPLCLLLALLARPARAQEPAAPVPREALAPALRTEVGGVLDDPTARCYVSPRPVRCQAEVYRLLLGQLPLAAKALRALELGDYRITARPAGRYHVDDRSGAQAECQNVWEESGRLVLVARGVLDVPVLPRIDGTGVVTIRYGPGPEGALQSEAWVSFRLHNRLLHQLTAPLRRVLEGVLRDKLAALIEAATALAEAVERDPVGVHRRLVAGGEATPQELDAWREWFLLR